MKRAIVLSLFVSTSAMALDFQTEWAKFADDFAKLKSKVSVTVDVPKVGNVTVPVEDAEVKMVDPKSPERLGHTLSDPALRERVTSLYQKPDTVVYSATIR
jgi:hypothetical protein